VVGTFTFRYDFNSKNYLTKDDVRILLSYVPFKRPSNEENFLTDGQLEVSPTHNIRKEQREQITLFID
jgi:hypothetical protein